MFLIPLCRGLVLDNITKINTFNLLTQSLKILLLSICQESLFVSLTIAQASMYIIVDGVLYYTAWTEEHLCLVDRNKP